MPTEKSNDLIENRTRNLRLLAWYLNQLRYRVGDKSTKEKRKITKEQTKQKQTPGL
jgi:soluble lytic murein transglycosylase-like protein